MLGIVPGNFRTIPMDRYKRELTYQHTKTVREYQHDYDRQQMIMKTMMMIDPSGLEPKTVDDKNIKCITKEC